MLSKLDYDRATTQPSWTGQWKVDEVQASADDALSSFIAIDVRRLGQCIPPVVCHPDATRVVMMRLLQDEHNQRTCSLEQEKQ